MLPSTSSSFGVGVVGCGFATTVFHAPLLLTTPGIRLVAISSSDPEKATKIYGDAVKVVNTPEELFSIKEIELVVIPTPNDSHHPLAVKALAAGKHVVIDKPFTVTLSESEDLIAKAAQANKLLSVFHNRRWDSDFLTLRKVIEEGQLGRLVHVESHFDRYRPEVRKRWREVEGPGTGLWYDLAPHLLDQVVVLFGMPSSIFVNFASQRDGAVVDDWFHAILEWSSGVRAVLHVTALSAWQCPRWQVHGTKGSFICWGLDCQEDQLKAGLKPGDKDYGIETRPAKLYIADGTDAGSIKEIEVQRLNGEYQSYYSGVKDAVLNGKALPVTAEEALRVMRLLEAGLVSAKEGRKITF